MSEEFSVGREQRESMLSMLMVSVEEKITAAEQLLLVVEADRGDVGGEEWAELPASGRRVSLLHAAKSMSLELGKAKMELRDTAQSLDPVEVSRLEDLLKEREVSMEALGNRLFQESEKYVT